MLNINAFEQVVHEKKIFPPKVPAPSF